MSEYVYSDTGVKVWTSPEFHPLLKQTDLTHPSFLAKLKETYRRGKVKNMPKIYSINSEDARTWHYFSPLTVDNQEKAAKLTPLLRNVIPESDLDMDEVSSAKVWLWRKIAPPPSLPTKERRSEPDVMIALGQHTIVLVEAKYKSRVSTDTTHNKNRDQVIRNIDVSSWYAKTGGYDSSYVIVLQYGDFPTNAKEIVSRYRGKPEAIQKALHYRNDLNEADYQRLSNSVTFVRWPNPLDE